MVKKSLANIPTIIVGFIEMAATMSLLCSQAIAAPDAAGVINTPLNVRRFPTAVLTNADSADIIAAANVFLSQCKVTLTQAGDVLDANGAPSVINSLADMNQACASTLVKSGQNPLGIARRYRFVNAINWCGGSAAGGTFLGCTFTPGTCIVVRRWTSLEGQVLAHEFGHSKGLQHRGDADAVMFASIGPAHSVFNAAECGAIRSVSLVKDGPILTQKSSLLPTTIEDFVSQIYPEGIPYDEAAKFQASDTAKVLPWLKDDTKSATWSNIVTVAGIVAGPDAEAALNELILRPHAGKLPIEQYDGRVAAIMSLGYIVKSNGSPSARQFLEVHVNPSSWTTTQWMAPYHTSTTERDNDLAAATVLGLSRVGDPAAVAFLKAQVAKLKSNDLGTPISLQRALRQALSDAKAQLQKNNK